MAIVFDLQVDPDSVSPDSANSAPMNSTATMLDDIPLDNAPVTLSPFTGEHFKSNVSFDHVIYLISLKGTNITILMQISEHAAIRSVGISRP